MGMIALALLGALALDGPDLAVIDVAVAKCDTRTMTRTFAEEPSRRRAFLIAAFAEQQEIVKARQALAGRRLAITQPGATIQPTGDQQAALDREALGLVERQKALDDARMLNGMREDALDLMRRQYISTCSGGRDRGSD